MSAYVEAETIFRDEDCLVEALIAAAEAMGVKWSVADIERHSIAEHLYGYRGDQRAEKANIIIRRHNVGAAANDIGFVRNPAGNFVAIVSEFDRRRYDEKFMNQVKQNYSVMKVRKNAKRMGYRVTEKRGEDGKVRLTLTQ